MKIATRVLDLRLDMFPGPKWPNCSFWVLNPKVKNFFAISWFYWVYLMILEKMRSCLWKLQLGFWTYGLIRLLGPSGPNVVSKAQTPWSFFLGFSCFYWIHPMIQEKIKSCLWKLELQIWTNGLISSLPKDLEPNCLKLGFRPQTPNVIALGSQTFFMSISIKFCIK